MKTNYAGHDRAYHLKRDDPDYVGWSKRDEFAEDWQLSWQPLIQRNAFPKPGRLLEPNAGVSVDFLQGDVCPSKCNTEPIGSMRSLLEIVPQR
jgi:hypothetical protein